MRPCPVRLSRRSAARNWNSREPSRKDSPDRTGCHTPCDVDRRGCGCVSVYAHAWLLARRAPGRLGSGRGAARSRESDQLKTVITFSQLPLSVEVVELARLEWDDAYGSNIAAALHLALAELDGEDGRIVLFSDMEATACVTDDGEVVFSYPPAPEAAQKSARAVLWTTISVPVSRQRRPG